MIENKNFLIIIIINKDEFLFKSVPNEETVNQDLAEIGCSSSLRNGLTIYYKIIKIPPFYFPRTHSW